MKNNAKRPQGFTLVELLVVIVIIAALASIATPAAFSAIKKADLTTATSNAKEIFKYMVVFDTDFGSFPDDSTSQAVSDATGTDIDLSGTSTSNDYMRQLIAADNTVGEAIFFAKTPYTKKPDNVITSGNALEAGEVGFGYILDNEDGLGTSSKSGVPVLIAPLEEGASDFTFDPNPYGGKAVILRTDNSVEASFVRDDKKVFVNGEDIGQSGTETVWGDNIEPTVVPPEPN